MKCCFCGTKITEIESNNPYPFFADDEHARCCSDCNSIYVLRARIGGYSPAQAELIWNSTKENR